MAFRKVIPLALPKRVRDWRFKGGPKVSTSGTGKCFFQKVMGQDRVENYMQARSKS
jgi:hypothetical protein